LAWEDVNLTEVKVISASHSIYPGIRPVQNYLYTYWGTKTFKLPFGLDWKKNVSAPISARAKHLDHTEFNYVINYVRILLASRIYQMRLEYVQIPLLLVQESKSGHDINGTVRIFIAPRYYRNGSRIHVGDQFHRFFSLDRFTVSCTKVL